MEAVHSYLVLSCLFDCLWCVVRSKLNKKH